MKKTIPVDQLKVGMFVHLEKAWFKHPFLSNSFHIESESQIRKIVDHRIRMVVIHPGKEVSPKEEFQIAADTQPPD